MKKYEKPELVLYGPLDITVDASPSNSAAVCLCDCALLTSCTNVGTFSCNTDLGTCPSNFGCTCDDFGDCV